MSATFEPIIGRYMHLELFGRPHRIYVEQAGEGTPLLCLHTAGSDGRQYRALMNDARVTSKHRVIAFDMPWHGKSSPPAGWHDEEYQLTSAQYTTMVLEISAALELDKPILIGCSIGGAFAGGLLGAHVVGRAKRESGLRNALTAHPCDGEGDAEIGDDRLPGLQQNVVRLEVAMHYAVRVCVVECGGE